MKKNKTQVLVLMAFYVALFMVMDYATNLFLFLKMPNGGSLGLSTIPLLIASYHLGYKNGLMVAVICVFVQFMTGPMYTPDILGFILDYFLAFSAYGLASCFPNFSFFYSGVLITNLIRFCCSWISGVIVWKLDWIGSLAYNMTYMLPTFITGVLFVPILMKSLSKLLKRN